MDTSDMEQSISADEAPAEELNRHAPEMGSEIDSHSTSAVLQLQVQGIVSDTIAATSKLLKASACVVASVEKIVKSLKSSKLQSTAHPNLGDWFTVKPFHMDFMPPASVQLTGSALYKVPRKCWLAKDYISHKYHARRMLYLQHVAAALHGSGLHKGGVRMQSGGTDLRRPSLQYTDAATGVSVLVSTTLAPGAFQCSKLAPDRNCLRSAVLQVKGSAEAQPAPTPIYNASVLSELLYHSLCTELGRILAPPRLQAVVCLVSRLLAAQVPDSTHTASLMDGLMVALASAVQTEKVTERMTVLQAFRALLTLVAASDHPRIALQADSQRTEAVPSISEHAALTPCVILDSSQCLNVLAGVPASAWRAVQAAAACTLTAFSGAMGLSGSTVSTLLQPTKCPTVAFDAVVRVQVEPVATGDLLGADAPWTARCTKHAEDLLKKALSDRVSEVVVVQHAASGAVVNRKGGCAELPGVSHSADLMVGMTLNPLEAYRLLDRGPPAEASRACAAFRKLWGDRAELRRLPDASIHEAVAWDSVAPHERCSIPDQIVKHILEKHIPDCKVSGTALMLQPALQTIGSVVDVSSAHRALDGAVHTLCQRLKQLEGLSLAVVSTQSVGPPCRHTACFPLQPHPLLLSGVDSAPLGDGEDALPRCVTPASVLVQVEGSGKWPGDAQAAEKLRAALGCQMAQELESQFGLHARATESFVDVHVQGFAIRFTIWSNRDDVLADQTKMGLKLKKDVRKVMVNKQGLAMLQQRQQVAHHGMVSSFIGENPSAAAACRFAKRWISSQMLSYHVTEEAVELMVVAAYTSSMRPHKPTSALAGFMRFLHLVSQHEWQAYPLLCDPAQALKDDEIKAALKAYRALLSTSSAPAVCLITAHDLEGSTWTKTKPSAVMTTRMRRLAATSLRCMTCALTGVGQWRKKESEEICSKIFTCDLNAFDALAMLRSEALPHSHLSMQPSALEVWSFGLREDGRSPQCISDVLNMSTDPCKSSRVVLSSIPRKARRMLPATALRQDILVGIDPIADLLQRLEEHLGHCCIFTADQWGGNVIGIKWKPKAFMPGPLRVPIAHTLCPVSAEDSKNGEVQYVVHKATVLQEVIHRGPGIVDDAVLTTDSES